MDGIIIFDMGHGGLARLASGAVLIQVRMQNMLQDVVDAAFVALGCCNISISQPAWGGH